MKKILLVTIMSLGIANISHAGFFDNKCTPVEKSAEKIKTMVKESDKLFSTEVNGWDAIQKKMADVYAINKEKNKEVEAFTKLCEKVEFKCEDCKELKEHRDFMDRIKKNDRESNERAIKMLERE
jgi:tryptophanyl-tRNA synthetase